MLCHKNINGFTLIELSIVIVIVGLIIAGITAGQSIVKSAKLRSVTTELQQYQSAINSFYQQYNTLPGDINSAFNYWGTNCAATAAACNGNGNGKIQRLDIANSQEQVMAWRHLNLAGLIPGNYTGTAVGQGLILGANTPASKYGGGWYIDSNPYWTNNVDPAIGIKNRICIGAAQANDNNFKSLLTPNDASTIDLKIDDGIPFTGKAIATGGYNGIVNPNCTQGAGATSSYQLGIATAACQMMFQLLK